MTTLGSINGKQRDGVVAAALQSIADHDPKVRSFSFVARDVPETGSIQKGPLSGYVVGVKDNIDVEGMPTTASSRVLEGSAAKVDAPVVSRLKNAGATVIGKTSLDEFAYGVFSPPTCNPWDLSRVPGGSSGGSAAAVAAGMCTGALGTDTAGSIRIPAALCGVWGLKPKLPIDMTGIIPLAPSLDACGPIGHNLETLTSMWGAIAGEERKGSTSERFRIGVAPLADVPLDSDVAPRYQRLIDALKRDDRIDFVPKRLPAFDQWERPAGLILAREAWEVHAGRGWFPDRAHLYSSAVRANLESASRIGPDKISSAKTEMEAFRNEISRLMSDVVGLLLPSTPCLAPTMKVVEEDRKHWTRHLIRFSAPMNFCDVAAVTVPVWDDNSSLPWGVDVVAIDEWTAFDIADHLPCGPPRIAEVV